MEFQHVHLLLKIYPCSQNMPHRRPKWICSNVCLNCGCYHAASLKSVMCIYLKIGQLTMPWVINGVKQPICYSQKYNGEEDTTYESEVATIVTRRYSHLLRQWLRKKEGMFTLEAHLLLQCPVQYTTLARVIASSRQKVVSQGRIFIVSFRGLLQKEHSIQKSMQTRITFLPLQGLLPLLQWAPPSYGVSPWHDGGAWNMVNGATSFGSLCAIEAFDVNPIRGPSLIKAWWSSLMTIMWDPIEYMFQRPPSIVFRTFSILRIVLSE